MRNKYQVIAYDPASGADERPEHATIKAAAEAARRYIDAGNATAAIIYNKAAGRIVRTFGYFPQDARPTEATAPATPTEPTTPTAPEKLRWYFNHGRTYEVFTVLYRDRDYILVQNDADGKFYFGLARDFGTLYGFPVNQSCLTEQEAIDRLNAFIRIDEKYIPSTGDFARQRVDCWQKMLAAILARSAS